MERIRRGEGEERPEKAERSEQPEDIEELVRRAWDELLDGDAEAALEEPPIEWDEDPEPIEDSEPEPQDEPERSYRGGRFCDLPREPGRDRHHLVAADSLRRAGMNPDAGLAIVMEHTDHEKTASHGAGRDAKAFRAEQSRLLMSGRSAEALALGILDVEMKFGLKYHGATEEAIDAVER